MASPAPGPEAAAEFDQFASLGKPKPRDNNPGRKDQTGRRCEMKSYEVRYNSRGERRTLEVGIRPNSIDRNLDDIYAFSLTRFYDRFQDLEKTQLGIRSPYVKKALQQVIVRYPGVEFHSKVVTIDSPLKCIFHYRKELQKYGSTLKIESHAEHLIFLLEYMYQTLGPETERWYNLMEVKGVSPSLDFSSLWMAFRPGSHVYTRMDGIDQVLKLGSISRCECPNPFCWRRKWTIHANKISFNGTEYGYETETFYIFPFEGFVPLNELKIFPLEYHPKKEELTATLVERGKKFISLQGIHYRYYDGVADALSPWRVNTIFGEEDQFPLQSMMIKGRVMIDGKTFATVKPSNKIQLDDELDPEKINDGDSAQPKLTDDDFLICTYVVPGFCFTTKRWCIFQVALIQDIEFNLQAFRTLQLPQHQKDMIYSLVKTHSSDGFGFDDLIKGKGKGMVFLLHGLPGVGKTLTAESVADITKRPLYSVNCGELGVNTNSVEANLSDALRLATTWNAIVLIDEADVFLEARSPNDLERNGLVSIFLRLLEYYQGILILTTNRIKVFDPAFKSRIHLAVKYHDLSPTSRRDLWKIFITSASSDTTPGWLDDEVLDRLAAEDINGRQIKNTVRTAQALAISESCPLEERHLNMSLSAMSIFEADFGEETAGRGDGDGDLVASEFTSNKRRRLD